ncbi:hypothetical protein REPUB_Repub08aG0132100 [Reevesia pubescens]
MGMVKINVDVPFDRDNQFAKLGVVARGANSEIIVNASLAKEYVGSALVSELHAIFLGLSLARNWNMADIIIESDCLVVVNEIRKSGASMLFGGRIVEDIRKLL